MTYIYGEHSSSIVIRNNMANRFYRITVCLMLFTCFFLTCEAKCLSKAWSEYRDACEHGNKKGCCECGNKYGYKNNCAHYLSNALIRAGYSALYGGDGYEMRDRNGFNVCSKGRPLRARELRDWFIKEFGEPHSVPRKGINVVYQKRADGQEHVLLKEYVYSYSWWQRKLIPKDHRGTGDYPNWPTQEYYY